MSKQNYQVTLQEFAAAIAGCNKQFPPKSTVTFAGQTLTPAQLVAVFTTAVSAINAVAPVRAQLRQLVSSQGAANRTARTLYTALKKYCVAFFGKGSPVLADFGFSVAQPRQPSVETKALGKAKAQLTRKARGTDKGKRQKQAVTASGSPGLVLYGPDGKPILGVTRGPTPPGLPAAPSGSTSNNG